MRCRREAVEVRVDRASKPVQGGDGLATAVLGGEPSSRVFRVVHVVGTGVRAGGAHTGDEVTHRQGSLVVATAGAEIQGQDDLVDLFPPLPDLVREDLLRMRQVTRSEADLEAHAALHRLHFCRPPFPSLAMVVVTRSQVPRYRSR